MLNTKQYNELEYIIALIDIEREWLAEGDVGVSVDVVI